MSVEILAVDILSVDIMSHNRMKMGYWCENEVFVKNKISESFLELRKNNNCLEIGQILGDLFAIPYLIKLS